MRRTKDENQSWQRAFYEERTDALLKPRRPLCAAFINR